MSATTHAVSSTPDHCYHRKRERPKRSAAEEHYLSEALASVRLRANHHDPYEEWKADLKEESLVRPSPLLVSSQHPD